MEKRKLRVFIYARVSSAKQAEPKEASLGVQIDEMEKEANRRGWQIVNSVKDVVSGSMPVRDREGGSQIYKMAEENTFDLLMVYDNDRIGRDEGGVIAKIFRNDLRQYKKQVYSVHQPVEPKSPEVYDPSADDSQLWLEAVTDTASSVYIRQFKRRQAFGMRKRIEHKKLITGTPPIGYLAEKLISPSGRSMLGERKLDPEYAPVIERIFNLYESGSSFQGIAGELNKEGSRTPKGTMWSTTTIKGIINNPTYYGAAVYYKEKSIGAPDPRYPGRRKKKKMPMDQWLIVDGGEHPAIIKKEQWLKCQELKKAKGTYGRVYGESKLLSGFLKCGFCGSSMYQEGNWQGGYYSCNKFTRTGKSSCVRNGIKRVDLEQFVIDYIGNLSNRPDILDKLKVKQNSAYQGKLLKEKHLLENQISEITVRLKKAREAFEKNIDSLEEYAFRKQELVEQKASVEIRIKQLTNDINALSKSSKTKKSLRSLLSNFSKKFFKKPLRIQKILLREIVDKVLIKNKTATIIFKDNLFQTSEYERSMEIAASGGHNVLLNGVPGSGKTLLARSFPSILPPLSAEEVLELTQIYSITGNLSDQNSFITQRPFRAPHHTASYVGIIGGGNKIKPGEVSLAHRGVLFLDELPEFPRQVLEALRQPLEDNKVVVSRAAGSITFPAQFMLLAAQNPCPCGFYLSGIKDCVCMPSQVARYKKKVSGPLLDRIDLHLHIPAVDVEKLAGEIIPESSGMVRVRVVRARAIQMKRFKGIGIYTNAEMNNQQIKKYCQLDQLTTELLKQAVIKLKLSARSYFRILKLSRTIADLAGRESIVLEDVAEALQFRAKEE